jgi:hypothetical protein
MKKIMNTIKNNKSIRFNNNARCQVTSHPHSAPQIPKPVAPPSPIPVPPPHSVYLFVSDSASGPGNITDWVRRAVTFTHVGEQHKAEAIECCCSPFTRPFREDQQAKHFARVLHEYTDQGWQIICVGHGHGAAVILDGLKRADWPKVEALHLVCPACEADFDRNGLNGALSNGRVGRVFVYCAWRDWVLRLAHPFSNLRRGHRSLGLHGTVKVAASVQDRVALLWWRYFSHSSCWRPKHFTRTMTNILFPSMPTLEGMYL